MPDLPSNPLRPVHDLVPTVEFQPYGDVEVVSTYGEPQAEYAAVRKGCAMMDLPQRGVLELAGRDRLTFLNSLLTNQTSDRDTKAPLPEGGGVYAFLLNAKTGRIIADVNVIERGDRTLLETDARAVEPVRQQFDRYLFSEQVTMTPRVGELHEIVLHGPGAPAVLGAAAEAELLPLSPGGSVAAKLFFVDVTIWRDDVCGVPGYHLLVPADDARTVWLNLISRFGQPTELGRRQLRPIGWAAFNACRIEAGRPLMGIDFDDSLVPAETGARHFARAVSLTKGCYPGQEIVARMHARQQVAKQIVGFRMSDDALPLAGTKSLDAQDNEVGGVTSSTPSPVLSNASIGLALVKRPHYSLGTTLRIPAEGAVREATIVPLPFLAG